MSKIKKASATVGAHHKFWCGIFRGPQIYMQSGSNFDAEGLRSYTKKRMVITEVSVRFTLITDGTVLSYIYHFKL